MCVHYYCNLHNCCYRFRAVPDEHYQAYADFSAHDCRYFIHMLDTKKDVDEYLTCYARAVKMFKEIYPK